MASPKQIADHASIAAARLLASVALLALIGAGCTSDPAAGDVGGENADSDWMVDASAGEDTSSIPDTGGDDDVGPIIVTDTDGSDTGDDGPDLDVVDTSGDGPDTTGDTGRDARPDAGMGLTDAAVIGTWYGLSRVTQMPAITGSMQEVVFKADKTVRLGFQGAVTGKWRVFDDDSVLLYELKQQDGQPNRPQRFVVEAELPNNRLEAFELFIGNGPDDSTYKLRYEKLGSPSIAYNRIVGQWQSKSKFTNQMGQEYRIVVRAEQSGKLAYGVYVGNYVEFSRGDGHTISYDTGETHWFIAPPSSGMAQAPLGGEVRVDASGNVVLWAPRGIQTNSTPQPEDFEAVEMEKVKDLSL